MEMKISFMQGFQDKVIQVLMKSTAKAVSDSCRTEDKPGELFLEAGSK